MENAEGKVNGKEKVITVSAPKVEAKAKPTPKEKKEAPKVAPKNGKKPNEKIAFLGSLISQAKFTRDEIVEKALKKFEGTPASTIRTYISDGKNSKYCKFPKLVTESEKGIVSFKAK